MRMGLSTGAMGRLPLWAHQFVVALLSEHVSPSSSSVGPSATMRVPVIPHSKPLIQAPAIETAIVPQCNLPARPQVSPHPPVNDLSPAATEHGWIRPAVL